MAMIIKEDGTEQLVEVPKKGRLEWYQKMLQAYLMEIKDKCEADGCVGFAFMKASEPHKGEFDNGNDN